MMKLYMKFQYQNGQQIFKELTMANRTININGLALNIIDLKGKDYLPVQDRVLWFRNVNPEWSIETEVTYNEEYCVSKATIKNEEGRIISTGFKREDKKHFQDFIEKSETGAIGRCLALTGYGTAFASELSEGIKQDSLGIVDSPRQNNGSAGHELHNGSSGNATRERSVTISDEGYASLKKMISNAGSIVELKKIWSVVSNTKDQLTKEQYAEVLNLKDQCKGSYSK